MNPIKTKKYKTIAIEDVWQCHLCSTIHEEEQKAIDCCNSPEDILSRECQDLKVEIWDLTEDIQALATRLADTDRKEPLLELISDLNRLKGEWKI